MLAGLDLGSGVGLEIGPLYRPLVHKSEADVYYIDHLDTEALIEKYRDDPNVDVSQIAPVDFVSEGDLAAAIPEGIRFDWVVASHVVEHVPDLIAWLEQLHRILAEKGELCLIVPDRRYTYDYERAVTTLDKVLAAHAVGATRPTAQAIADFALNCAPLDVKRAWRGTIKPAELAATFSPSGAFDLARESEATGEYRDVHVWVFTPRSFARLMGQLAKSGLLGFGCGRFVDTRRDEFEFYVRLYPESDPQIAAASWKAMDAEARLGPRIANLDDIPQADFEDQLRHLKMRLAQIEGSRSWKAVDRARKFKRRVEKIAKRKKRNVRNSRATSVRR